VAHRDRQSRTIRELLECPLPESYAGAVAASAVGRDEQGARLGV